MQRIEAPHRREHLTARDDGATRRDDLLQDAIGGRGNLEDYFVRLEIDEILFTPDRVAGLLVPSDERSVGYGLGELRNLDLDAHVRPTLALPLARL